MVSVKEMYVNVLLDGKVRPVQQLVATSRMIVLAMVIVFNLECVLATLDGVDQPAVRIYVLISVSVKIAPNKLDVDGVMISKDALLALERDQGEISVSHGFTILAEELLFLSETVQQISAL
jgi:hypothetical protein